MNDKIMSIYVRVRVKDDIGVESQWSDSVSFMIVTVLPIDTNPQVSNIGTTSATISWNSFDISDPISSLGYLKTNLYMYKWDGIDWVDFDIDGDGSVEHSIVYTDERISITISTLEPNTQYKYAVIYYDIAGNVGIYSNYKEFTTLSDINLYNYVYDENNRLIKILENSKTKIAFIYDKNGNILKKEIYEIPNQLTILDIQQTEATLGWNALDNIVKYKVYINGVFYMDTTINSINIIGLNPGQSYQITVSVVYSSGEGTQSLPITVTTNQ